MEQPLSNERLLKEYANRDIHAFLDIYNITNDQGEVLDFKDHPYLIDLYSDWSHKIVVKKAAQVAFSTTMNHKMFWAAKNRGLDIIYSMPTADDVKDFVSGKTNRLISHNPIYQEWTKDKDSIEQKRIGDHVIYFRGTMTERAALATPADLYIADEVDRSDQKIVEQFSSRLQHSKFGWEWWFSNPSVPENGVDKRWQNSDQKEWFVKCESCTKECILSLENIDITNNQYICLKCGHTLDQRNGRWIKRFQDREISGYHTSLLMAPWIKPSKILELKKDKSDQYFQNFVMGEPYVGAGNYLPRHTLFANLTGAHNPQDAPPVIGVDTGKRIHFVVGNKYGLFFNGSWHDYEPIEAILKRDKRAIAIIDQGGDIVLPRKLQEQYPGQVYLCTFTQRQDVAPLWKEEIAMVNMDRNKGIQLVVDEFSEKRVPLFGDKGTWEEYADHWSHLYRVIEEDERGRRKYIWERNGDDHLALATLYWRIGMEKVIGGEGELIMPGEDQMYMGMDIETGKITRATLKTL